MKQFFISILIVLTSIALFGQDPDFSMDYEQNRNLINPAYMSRNNFISLNILYNKEWIYPGAPAYGTFWMSGKFAKHMGMGFQISSKTVGIFHKTQIGGTYAFDVTLDSRSHTYLGFGLSGGLFQDFFGAMQTHSLQTDPFLAESQLSRYYPQAAAGLILYSDFYEIGFSALRLLPYSGYFLGSQSVVLPPVFILHGAYYYRDPLERFGFSPDFVMSFSKDRYYLQADITGLNRKKNIKYGGGLSGDYIPQYKTVRLNMTAFVGFRITERLFIIYKFDFRSINMPIPMLTKLGNSIALRLDFYPNSYDIPDFF